MSGVFIGFGSALSILAFTAWTLLQASVDSRYLVVREAKVMIWGQFAANLGIVLGILLIVSAFGIELLVRKYKAG